jgi:chromosome segregation ATPase
MRRTIFSHNNPHRRGDYSAEKPGASNVLPALGCAVTISGMADLMGKLNVLVRSSIQGVLRDEGKRRRKRGPVPSLSALGDDIDQEVAALRQQIDRALDDEERLVADLDALQRQSADWDDQADQALRRGDEATARHAIRQMQTLQQRATMLESDLAQHRISTSELISRVNELEALVAEARHQHQQQPPIQEQKPAPDHVLSARLRKARLFIETQEMEAIQQQPSAAPPVDDRAVDDDLAQRRARLSQ